MLHSVLHSLRHRDFRVYYLGQLVSINGTWMQQVAQAWLVYRLTDSSTLLGLVAFAGLVPILLLGLPAGVLADRVSRHRLMVTAQALALLQALTLAALTLSGVVQVWHILLLALFLGTVHALEMPARHSLLAQLVPRSDLPNAIALNSGMFNLARFIGPAIAGWLVALSGEGVVFLVNAATFLVVLLSLLTIHPRAGSGQRRGTGAAIVEGVRYLWHEASLRNALFLLASVSLVMTAYSVLMPLFADRVFGGGPNLLGILLGSAGGGAFLAALRLAYLGGRQTLERHIGVAATIAGGSMIAFSQIPRLWLALSLLAVTGYALTTAIASINTLLQLQTPEALRGRTMALFSVLFIGLTSIGNLAAGAAAERLGAPLTVTLFGTACLLAGAVYGWRHRSGDHPTDS